MNYTFNKKYIVRTPLNPIKTSFTKEELLRLFTKKKEQEALFLSSPNLLNEFLKWQKGEIKDKIEEEKIVYSLLKYAIRMHTRCTPFGLFAGCNALLYKKAGTISLDSKNFSRSTRLDMNFTCSLAQKLAKLNYIEPHIRFYPNTSIYNLSDKLRYVEYYYENNKRVHQISSVDNSSYLNTILKKAQEGATINELSLSIVNREISIGEANEFVKELIESQLLVSQLEPEITGKEILIQIVDILKTIQNKHPNKELENLIIIFKDVKNQLDKIDSKSNNEISAYEKIANILKQLDVPFELNKLFQTDMFIHTIETTTKIEDELPQQSIVNDDIHDNLIKAITALNQLSFKPEKTNISEFQQKFHEKYGENEVELLDALDVETGVGYAKHAHHLGDFNPLVNDLKLPYSNFLETELKWNQKESFLFNKLLISAKDNLYKVKITEEELKDFENSWDDLPDSMSVMYKHFGTKNNKQLLSINSVGGSSAINLLGRFASSNTSISELVFEIAEKEQLNKTNAVYAEIIHLPESRTGNILMRPAFRSFEIPYLSKSTMPLEKQIQLNDLYLSIKNNQLYLRSKRLNKQVIPRLGNAHNFSYNSLPVYQFLCDFQTQNLREGLYFNWGKLANEFSFLPQVEIDGVIVFTATWQIKRPKYQELLEKNINVFDVIKSWKKELKIPDLFLLVEGDNEMLIDLQNELSIEMFIAEIKKKPNITLKEYLFDEKTAIVRDEKGNAYTNEFIAILQKKNIETFLEEERVMFDDNLEGQHQPNNNVASSISITNKKIIRTFSLGSEWLYYKIYCGVKTADTILTEVIRSLTEHLMKEQLIESWFFIRYADPDIHLRVRLHLTDLKNIGTVINLFQNAIAAYEQSGLIWKVQTDTYQREIERYGENAMLLGEQIFYHDSKCIVDVLEIINGDEGEEIRWLFAIKMVDALLVDFNYSDEQKRDLLDDLKTGFALEFNMNKGLKMQLDKKFRTYRQSITDVLDTTNDATSELQPLFELLSEKSFNIKPIVSQILELHQNNELPLSLNDLLASYIHMLLNRLFKNKQRIHEMVVYDLMWRTYRSELAKQQQLNKQLVN